jgi:hypothetical protein
MILQGRIFPNNLLMGTQVPRAKGPFHLKVNRYYRMKSIQNRLRKWEKGGNRIALAQGRNRLG